MNRKLFGVLTGWQVTLLAMTAMIVPGAVVAVPSYSNVAIEDTFTGMRASVDKQRRLSVYDPVYRNDPANFVHFELKNCGASYQVPSGKGLVITALYIVGFGGTQGSRNFVEIYDSTALVDVAIMTRLDTDASESAELGTGSILYSGSTLTSGCVGFTNAFGVVNGYLVPSAALPAPQSAEALAQFPPGGALKHR